MKKRKTAGAKKLWKKRPLVARPLVCVTERERDRGTSPLSTRPPLPTTPPHHPSSPHGRNANSLSDRARRWATSPPGASWEKGKTFPARLSRSRRRARLWLKVKKKKSDDGREKKRGGEICESHAPDGERQKCLIVLPRDISTALQTTGPRKKKKREKKKEAPE